MWRCRPLRLVHPLLQGLQGLQGLLLLLVEPWVGLPRGPALL